MIAFWWAIGIALTWAVGALLSVVLIGIPILAIAGILSLILFIWFTVKSFFGLLS